MEFYSINNLGIILDNALTWSNHIELLMKKKKLTIACYETVKPHASESALKMICHSLFHLILSCGIIFWGDSAQSIAIFKAHKKVIRVMMGCRSRNLCTNLFKILNILPLKSQYMFSLLIFVVHNKTYTFHL
jgi:hypothetical protein